jgi:hypothetical protein
MGAKATIPGRPRIAAGHPRARILNTGGRRLLLVWAALALSLAALLAQDTATPPQSANRYLFIVQTSRSMESRSNGVISAVQGLLDTGFKDQLRSGDSIGLWTYSDEPHVGKFPLQTWTPKTRAEVTAKVVEFLQGQSFEKRANLSKVYDPLALVVKRSEFITIIFVTDGSEKIERTPFDAQINAQFKSWHAEQQRTRNPFLTILRARRGKLTQWLVGTPPWPLELPALPADLKLAVAKTPKKPEPEPPPVIGEPLIVTGKKPGPASPPQTRPATTEPASKPPLTTTAPPATATLGQATPPQSQAVAIPPGPAPVAPAIPAGPKATPAQAAPGSQVQGGADPAKPALPPAVATPSPHTAQPQGIAAPPDSLAAPGPEAQPTPGNAATQLSSAPTTHEAPSRTTLPIPAKPGDEAIATAPNAGGLPVAAAPSTTADSMSPASNSRPVTPSAPAQTAVVTPPQNSSGSVVLWSAGVGVVVLGAAVWLVLRRRARAEPVSLITQSWGQKDE